MCITLMVILVNLFLCTVMCIYRHAQRIPMWDQYEDILRVVTETPKLGCYVVDLPRAANNESLDQVFGALEPIKQEFAFNNKTSYQEIFERPNVIIFSSRLPD
jgi:hypothetical protein